MIQLDDSQLIGKGKVRYCYLHPDDSTRCIKIEEKQEGKLTSNEKEALYYKKLLWLKPNYQYRSIARFYGWVETNLGMGAVFELIKDETTCEVSQTLRAYFHKGLICIEDPRWEEALKRFKDDLLKTPIMLRDVGAHNICVKQKQGGDFEFIAIDGIGHRDFIPLVDFIPWFARRRMTKRFEHRFLTSIATLLDSDF